MNSSTQTEGIYDDLRKEIRYLKEKIKESKSILYESIKMFENCRYCSKLLLNLINDMMDLAKSEKMKFELNNQLFDLENTVQRSFENMTYMAFEKNIDLSLKIDDKLYPFIKKINGDENRYT